MTTQTHKFYNFLGLSKLTFTFSITLSLIAFIAFGMNGLKFGLDFTGGTLIEVGYDKPADLDSIRSSLEKGGFHGAIVQHFGSETAVLIRMQNTDVQGEPEENASVNTPVVTVDANEEQSKESKLAVKVLAVLQSSGAHVQMRRIEYVGPQVGDQLKSQALLAIALAFIAVAFYLAFRFQYKFALAAILALFHDVVITVGCFALFGWEFDLIVLAAVLSIIGYSLNDTIVVYDRIRENLVDMRQTDIAEVINVSITQTIRRTSMTSIATLITVVALFAMGGEMLRGFSLTLIIGIAFGTYSSVYVASSLLPVFGVTREDLIPVEKEQVEFDTP